MPRTPKAKESKEKITYISKGTVVRVTNCAGVSRVGIMDDCNHILGHVILADKHRLAFGVDAKVTEVPKNTPLSVCDYIIEHDKFLQMITGESYKGNRSSYDNY